MYEPVVLLVPFFGGEPHQLKRHVLFLNGLGFDAAIVPLKLPSFSDPRPPLSRDGLLGLKHVWADRIEDALVELNQPSILFTFSSPSASAIEVIARSFRTARSVGPTFFQHAGQLLWGKVHSNTPPSISVRAIISDSGPFVKLWSCNWKYMFHEAGIEFPPLRGAATAASVLIWGPDYEKTLDEDLRLIGPKVPMLSIRGWSDKLVSIEAMDKAFPHDANLNLKVVSIPGAGHLDALKKFPEIYEPAVEKFLASHVRALVAKNTD